jgi:hypothetical protein
VVEGVRKLSINEEECVELDRIQGRNACVMGRYTLDMRAKSAQNSGRTYTFHTSRDPRSCLSADPRSELSVTLNMRNDFDLEHDVIGQQ